MASGFQGIGKIPELRRRILFTLALLAVYRMGVFVTTPGVDASIMKQIISSASGSFLGMFNMFSGGALEQMSIFALGIMPYISSSIILQLLTVVVPKLEQIKKEGDAGQRRLNQYTRYGTIFLSLIQSFFIAKWLISNNSAYAQYGVLVPDPDWSFVMITMISLTTGTAFIMWLGEQITERGIGNGISLIIFAGIVSDMPDAVVMLFSKAQAGELTAFTLAIARSEELVHRAQVGLTYGLVQTAGGLVEVLAPPIAGVLYARSPTLPFVVSLVIIAATIVGLIRRTAAAQLRPALDWIRLRT